MAKNAATPSLVDPERKKEVSTGPVKFPADGLQPSVDEIKIDSGEHGEQEDDPIGKDE